MPHTTVLIPAMHCEHCKKRIEAAVTALEHINAIHVDLDSKNVTVMWDEPQTWQQIAATLSAIGYPPMPVQITKRHVAIVLYDGFTALDAVGPYEILVSLPATQVHFVSDHHGPVTADTGQLQLIANKTWHELPLPDVIVIPGGGTGLMKAVENHALRNWLLEAHAHSMWTTSVCTGVFLLGVTGIVAGLNVTTHWGSRNAIASYCQATYLAERFVVQGKIITAAGVSAGIDMALYLAQQLSDIDTAQAIQLACEYDPQPPFQSGNFQTTDERLHHAANQVIQLHRINPVSQIESSSEL